MLRCAHRGADRSRDGTQTGESGGICPRSTAVADSRVWLKAWQVIAFGRYHPGFPLSTANQCSISEPPGRVSGPCQPPPVHYRYPAHLTVPDSYGTVEGLSPMPVIYRYCRCTVTRHGVFATDVSFIVFNKDVATHLGWGAGLQERVWSKKGP